MNLKHRHLRILITFGTLVLTGLLVVQLYWFKRAFDAVEREFDHSVQMALKKVADTLTANAPVKKVASNFFLVPAEAELDDRKLSALLDKEFSLRNLSVEYELGIYNAEDDTLLYGHYLEATRRAETEERLSNHRQREMNFVVYFPRKESYLAGELNIWIFSTAMLVLMLLFFAYALISLLRERKFTELKSDFINNMAHEFKTPVTNIGIAGDVLKAKITDENLRVYVDILLKENEKLKDKISRALSGESVEYRQPILEKIDIHQIIHECAEAFHLKVQERNGQLQIVCSASNSVVLADRHLLTQALTNIIDNAEKYSPNKPSITVTTRENESYVEIVVEDNGIGISPAWRKKVFEKFFRVPSGDVHNVKGFGIGLNFVQKVIQSHKGKVELWSELNRGTAVKILLPKI